RTQQGNWICRAQRARRGACDGARRQLGADGEGFVSLGEPAEKLAHQSHALVQARRSTFDAHAVLAGEAMPAVLLDQRDQLRGIEIRIRSELQLRALWPRVDLDHTQVLAGDAQPMAGE